MSQKWWALENASPASKYGVFFFGYIYHVFPKFLPQAHSLPKPSWVPIFFHNFQPPPQTQSCPNCAGALLFRKEPGHGWTGGGGPPPGDFLRPNVPLGAGDASRNSLEPWRRTNPGVLVLSIEGRGARGQTSKGVSNDMFFGVQLFLSCVVLRGAF